MSDTWERPSTGEKAAAPSGAAPKLDAPKVPGNVWQRPEKQSTTLDFKMPERPKEPVKEPTKMDALKALGRRAMAPIRAIPGEVGKEFREGAATAKKGAAEMKESPNLGVLEQLGGAAQALFSPITGVAKAVVGKPGGSAVKAATGSDMAGRFTENLGTDVASMVGPKLVTESLGAVSKALPKFNESVQKLLDAGVQLTPGQIFRGLTRNAEDSLKSIPGLGHVISNGQRNSIETFNKAVLNAALKPIGEKMPKDLSSGRTAIAFAERKIGEAYDKVLPKVSLKVDPASDPQLSNDVNTVVAATAKMPEAEQKQFNNIMTDFFGHADPTTYVMDGRTWKQAESELGYVSRDYIKSENPAQRQLGRSLDQVRGALRDALERQNPKYAQQLGDANSAWAAYTRARDASIRRAGSQGIFSPADLIQTVKSGSAKGSFSRGDALLQDFAEAANSVLPSTVPDSGTAGRSLWALFLGEGAKIEPHLAVGGALASLPYTKPGMRAVSALAKAPVGRTVGQVLTQSGTPAMISNVASDLRRGETK